MGGVRFFGLVALVALILGSGAPTAQAQGDAETFTLQPGGRATISFEAFCTEFGEVFASAVQGPSGLAPDAVRAALAYGINKGLNADGAQALQLQYALWRALGEASSPAGEAAAQDVITNGTAVPAPPQATSLLDAAKAGQVSVTLDSWAPIGPKVAITATASDNFYGSGRLTVTNTSQQALTLYMPVGTLFPSVNPAQQTMAGYATDIQVSNPQAAPQQLPNTSGGASSAALLLLAALLLASSMALRLAQRRAN